MTEVEEIMSHCGDLGATRNFVRKMFWTIAPFRTRQFCLDDYPPKHKLTSYKQKTVITAERKLPFSFCSWSLFHWETNTDILTWSFPDSWLDFLETRINIFLIQSRIWDISVKLLVLKTNYHTRFKDW